MEQKSCSLYGRCRDRNTGKLTKVSELHRDLLGLGKIQKLFTRQKANKAFYLSQSPKFLERYQEDLVFTSEDADSEPKLASFFEAAKQIMPEVTYDNIRDLLAKKFKEGVYSYKEAYDRMTQFNQSMDGGTSFIATLVPQKDGKYEFKIVPNSAQEQEALIQVISDRVNAEAIIQQLENLKIGIADGAKAMYDTNNPQVLTNGLLGLITITGGRQNAAYNIKDLASETGHAIVGMLGENDKLYQRLKKVVEEQPEVVRELLGNEEFAAYQGTKNATKEFMGHIVGLYLEQWNDIKPNTKLKTIGTLIQRMADWLRSKLHFTNRDFYTARYNAKWTAYNMVKDFMGNNFQGNLQNALSEKETLQGDLNVIYSHLTTALQKLHEMVESSKNFGYNAHKNYKDTFHQLMGDVHEINLMKNEATTAMEERQIEKNSAEALLRLANFLINELYQTKNLLNFADSGTNGKGEHISNAEIAKVVKYAQQVLDLTKQINEYSESIRQTITDEDLKQEISDVFGELSAICHTHTTGSASGKQIEGDYQSFINKVRHKLALRLLVQINGSDFIAMSQRVELDGGRILRKAMHARNIEDIMGENLSVSPISRWIDSIADSRDAINQIIYDAVEQKKHEANVKTLDIKDKLFTMYQNLRDLGVRDTRRFYEVDSLGHLTGNLISERNWGEWERLYKEDKKEFENAWYEANKNWLPSKIDMYHNPQFLTAFGAWREGWHNDHSIKLVLKDDDGNDLKYPDGKTKKRWVPAISSDTGSASKPFLFDNPAWEKLQQNPPLAKWYKEYMTLKKELDALLPDGSTNALGVRAPQFIGTTTDRLANSFTGNGKPRRVLGMALRRYLIHNISVSPSDTEYGGEHDTYDGDEIQDSNGSVIFTRAHMNVINSIDRVPIFGVKKLPHMDDLSTDLIHSTLAYAAMATSYNCLDEVAEVASQVAEARKDVQDGSRVVSKLKERLIPWGYNRLIDYLNMQVYNNYKDPDSYLNHAGPNATRVARKISGIISGLGSVWMLGWNFHSAFTNAYTGFNEIWKEAHGGEEFNKTDFAWACAQYIGYFAAGFLQNVCNLIIKDGSILEATTKMHLFHKMYDIQNENERKFRDYHVQTIGWGFMKGWSYTDIAMLPYTITDRWMQSISFLAAARHTKLKNKKDGKEYSLWDAYTVVEEEEQVVDKNGNIKTVKSEPKLVLKDVETGKRGKEEDWLIFNKNQARLNEILSSKEAKGEALTIAEKRAIYQQEVTGPTENIEFKRDPYTNKEILIDPYVPFDNAQQSRFRTRCRGINNRMHGVYNRGDGGAFQKFAIASMAASMKKYAIGLIDRRFAFSRYDFRTGEFRQGSTITMGALFLDCFTAYSSGQDNKIIEFFDTLKLNYPTSWKNILGDAAKLFYGLTKFFYITLASFSSITGVDQYLRNRGYSENQIANVRRSLGDIFRPLWIQFLMSFVSPPDDDKDKDETLYDQIHGFFQEGVDFMLDSWPVEFVEDALSNVYLGIVKNSIFGDPVIEKKKNKVLTKKYLDRIVQKHNKDKKSGMFDIRGILYYQLYRGLLEQKAYEVTRPLSMFQEYKGIFDAALPGLTAINDMVMTTSLLLQNVDEEELKEMKPKERKKFKDGKEIYVRGDNKYWYKYIKKLLKVGPTRTLETWLNGYASQEALQHYKEPFAQDKYQEGAFNINRR